MTEEQFYSLGIDLSKYAKEISNKRYFVQINSVYSRNDFEDCIILKLYYFNNNFIEREYHIEYLYNRNITFSNLKTNLQKLIKQKVFEIILDEENI